MVFLKSLKAHGFKSFAEPLTINFTSGMIGIVGPNGSGKSNINDALKWALGEQSLKSLRGKNAHDIIFSGSDKWSQLNFAEVELTFNNQERFFDIPYDEVQIKRKVFRNSNANEYYINNELVRFKDVQLLAYNSGLAKSSLALISQGQVTNFAAMPPSEKRLFFDQAAGLNEYKSQKKSALAKLSKAEENIARIKDIVSEIKRKLPSLERQNRIAKKYQTQLAELQGMELSIITKDITAAKAKLELSNAELISHRQKLQIIQFKIEEIEANYNQLSKDNYQLELACNELNKQYKTLVTKLSQAQAKEEMNSTKREVLIKLQDKKTKANWEDDFVTHNNKLSKIIDKLTRLEQIKQDLDKQSKHQNSTLITMQQQIEQLKNKIINFEQQIKIANRMHQDHKTDVPLAVSEILKNQHILPGVDGLVMDLFTTDPKYNEVVNLALGNRKHNIIVDTTVNTKQLIKFLQQNQLGKATFLPRNNVKGRTLNDEVLFILENTPGFVAVFDEIIECEHKYDIIKSFLVGQIILAEDYDSALAISRAVKQKFNVISLDGEWIKPFGAILGGSKKVLNRHNSRTTQVDVPTLNLKIKKLYQEHTQAKNAINKQLNHLKLLNDQILNNAKQIGMYQFQKEQTEQKIAQLNADYKILFGRSLQHKDDHNKSEPLSSNSLSELEFAKSNLENEITLKQNLKLENLHKNQNHEKELRTLRDECLSITQQIGNWTAKQVKAKNKLNNLSTILIKDYKMTYDYALTQELTEFEDEAAVRKSIKELRYNLSQIKSVNLDAIEEYETTSERYNFMFNEYTNLTESAKNLLGIIHKLDRSMLKTFKSFFAAVNAEIPSTFKELFGGGTARLVLEDDKNILTSGIEIELAPPGKKITHLNLLSGGEKSLTALSILFAVLKVRPLPLVMLDEVEATLDPSNVEKFARYLKTFSSKTQFIIVTHRLGTMENCDILYGTTMQNKGVTKMVSIKLVDAQKMISTMEAKKEHDEK